MAFSWPTNPSSVTDNSAWDIYGQAAGRYGAPSAGGTTAQTSPGSVSPGATPDLASLTDLVNKLNRNAQTSANDARIPNNPALESASSANIGSELAGHIPSDVITQMNQAAAERGVAIGSPGSDNSNAALLRSLGLTSLDLQQRGQANLSAADARNPGAPIFDPTSQLLTPYQSGQLALGQGQLNIDWLRALNQGTRTGTGGGGGGSPATGTAPNNAWWKSLFPATSLPTSPVSGTNIYNPSDSGMYPGTSVPGLPDLGSIIGPVNQDYNPPPYGTVSGSSSSTYDPFMQYSDYNLGNTTPSGTVSGDQSSTYDPFAQYSDYAYSGF